jgi:segregation and condensation protein B
MNETSEENNGGADLQELKNIIEAAIMIADEPLTIDRMLTMFPPGALPERAQLREIIDQLEQEYLGRGIELKRIDKGFRLQTREDYAPWLSRLQAMRPQRYSRALLETLAIIAYRQPVTRGDIEEVRGVAVSSEIIRTLQERDWVRQVGVRDVPGRPALFGTTRAFLEYFNLQGLSQLPELPDIRDMDTIAAELNLSLPLEETDTEVDTQADDGQQDDQTFPERDIDQPQDGHAADTADEPQPTASEQPPVNDRSA